MGHAIGIDFGTSECCVYAVKNGAAVLVPSQEGTASTPTCVAVTDDGEVLVGRAARRQAVRNPNNTISGIKRLFGRKFQSRAIDWLTGSAPWEIVPAANGDAWVRLQGDNLSPPALASHLLAHLCQLAEAFLGAEVDEAVITVPTYFDELQRRAMVDAAAIAGVPLLGLLNDTSAAAMGRCFGGSDRRLAVLDLGAGYFDISILEARAGAPGTLRVIASAGDVLLGGDDFDRRLVDLLIDDFYQRTQLDLSDSPTAVTRLYEACRTAKHELSSVARSNAVDLPMITFDGDEPVHLHHDGVSRDVLHALVTEELERLAAPCGWVFDDASLGTDDVDEILLVGGMMRSPLLQEQVEYLFNKRPTQVTNADEIVALGAALHAGHVRGELDGFELEDVSPHSIGVKLRGGRFSPLIARNQPIPCRETRTFAGAQRGAGHMILELYQGEAELVTENIYIGRFSVASNPSATGGGSQVELAFDVDPSGLLEVSALTGGAQTAVVVQRSVGLTPRELERARTVPPAPPAAATVAGNAAEATFAALRKRAIEERKQRQAALASKATHPAAPAAPAVARHDMPTPPRLGREASTVVQRAKQRSLKPPPMPRPQSIPPSIPPEAPIEVAGDSLVGTTLSDRYVIEAIVADGGMGRVYRARHKILGRALAVKVLHPELAAHDDIAQRFVREAQAASMIDNEHVIEISDFGRLEDGTGYFVMEYLEGPTLADLIKERGALPADLIVDVGLQIADGLMAAHALGIVHRDLKPENVSLEAGKSNPYFCKILDFGIAKSPTSDTSQRVTIAGTLLGTPHYMAPEQIDGADVDARSDIYSLGAVFYEMATGRTPFEADTVVNLLVQHKIAAPKPIHEHPGAEGCPRALAALIMRCLEKRPQDRFDSVADLAAALAAVAR